MIQILKLTPPQIAALRRLHPGLVAAGVLTTTNSVATFAPVPSTRQPVLAEPWTVARVRTLVAHAAHVLDPKAPLLKVLEKIDTRPDLVREV